MVADVHRRRYLTPRETFASNVAPSCRLVSPHTWADSNRLPRLQCRDKHGSASFTCAGSAATRNSSALGWKGAFSTFISYLRWTTLQQKPAKASRPLQPPKGIISELNVSSGDHYRPALISTDVGSTGRLNGRSAEALGKLIARAARRYSRP
jgi:hypothetical protein